MAQVQTAEGRIQKNSYDAEGLRHEMEENGQLVKFLYNENREVVAEEESTGNIIRYIRGLGLISSDSENARTYYHYVSDEQGSITHMVDGENGTIPNHYTYDAFGNTIHCEEQVHNRFRYNGEQYDPVTSQYYLRARFYNPAIARFTQEDTYYGDGLNLYRYCANNPVAYQDPSGHNICPGQLSLYKKHKAKVEAEVAAKAKANPKAAAEVNIPREAYGRMRTELGLSSKNPFTADSQGGTVSVLQKQLEGGSSSKIDYDLIKDYVRDVESRTGIKLSKNQIEELKNALRNKEYTKLTVKETAKHRNEFNNVKNRLINEWETNTGQKWPTYTEDVISLNTGKVVRKVGDMYDAHHIIENSYGGEHEWWNIHPAKFPNEHQSGIHGVGSPANKLFSGGN